MIAHLTTAETPLLVVALLLGIAVGVMLLIRSR